MSRLTHIPRRSVGRVVGAGGLIAREIPYEFRGSLGVGGLVGGFGFDVVEGGTFEPAAAQGFEIDQVRIDTDFTVTLGFALDQQPYGITSMLVVFPAIGREVVLPWSVNAYRGAGSFQLYDAFQSRTGTTMPCYMKEAP